ncbi:MAG: FecR domain-containing protein [Bacteroidota bacterium]
MKYTKYNVEDFVADAYFQKWVLDSDGMTNTFWENWLQKHPSKKPVVEKAKELLLLMSQQKDTLSTEDFDSMWQHIIEQRDDKSATRPTLLPKRHSGFQSFLKVAAVFIGLLATGWGVYQTGIFDRIEMVPDPAVPQVTLELEDGTIKVLDENQSGLITDAEGTAVVNQQQHTLVYNAISAGEGSKKGTGASPVVYNQLTVPYGKKFDVVLSDGSTVFLNSGSKLRYPVNFLSGSPRDVYLDGEGYFDVTDDKMRPFTVITDDMNTQVYGTEFNVSSYKNEGNTSTVLVEGSVGVYRANNEEGIKPLMITPGQRAVYDSDEIAVEEVPIRKYVAWKDGLLYFVDDRFELLLKELERHFNVSIDNQYKDLEGKRFTGTFTNESLEQILKVARAYGKFEYTIDGDQITITKTNEE